MVDPTRLTPTRALTHPSWSWTDEGRNTDTRMCLCCGRPGHYQQMVEAHVAEHGVDPVYVESGVVKDGHHRIVAAIRQGIPAIPTETKAECEARWVRDHGYVSWDERKFGDV
jgi:hypothetical protein